jgi:trimeric autotransporter adhesin
MRRFLSLVVLLFITVPFGASLAGCGNKTVVQFCSGGDSGPVVGQVKTITLSQNFAVFGESLNFGQIGSSLSASAVDCKGSPVSVRSFVFASSDLSFADINPNSGAVCAGTYNRFTGGGIPDYTICNPPVNPPATGPLTPLVAYVTATADGAVSNPIPVYIHPIVTSIVLGDPSPTLPPATYAITGYTIASTGTTFTTSVAPPSIGSNLILSDFPPPTFSGAPVFNGQPVTVTSVAGNSFSVTNVFSQIFGPVVASGIATSTTVSCAPTNDPATNCCPLSSNATVTAPAYTGGSCLSQGVSAQLTARVYKNGTTNPSDNITCQIGHLQYAAQTASVFTVDQNGVATAAQPGSSIVTATVSNSGTGGAAGFFSTCPPASIQLAIPGQTSTSATVAINTSQPLTALVKDAHGVVLTGINLEFNSTTPSTIQAGAGTVAPIFPGSATITAVCQPSSCNTAPFSQIGLFGNGDPLTSNGIQITTPGNNATVLYIASTQSQFLLPVDFSQSQPGTLVKLPYFPNSMVISQDGSSIFMGSSTALMIVSALNNQVTSTSQSVPGKVLSVSPSGGTVVVTDADRKTVSLVTNTGTVSSTYGGVGISAQWSPDSQTVYIAAQGDVLLVHSPFTGWTSIPTSHQYVDVAVTVPSIGAYFATSDPVVEAHSYCPDTTSATTGNPPVTTNIYYPLADDSAAKVDKIAATNDGIHILGATATPSPALSDLNVTAVTGPVMPGAPPPIAIQACPAVGAFPANYFPTTVNAAVPLAGVTATSITGVVPASNSALAFVTYTGTSGQLPLYIPAASGPGTLNYVTLSGGPTSAPVAGVFSTDNKTFYAGTSGDNQVHLITVTGTTATDSSVIAPKLPDANGNPVAPNLLVQRPKKATS